LGFHPSGASPPKEPRRLVGWRQPSWRSLPAAVGSHGLCRPRAPLPRASRIRDGAFTSPSGPLAPRESVRSGIRVYVCRTSIPSWASASLRFSPCPGMRRISPPLLSRALVPFGFFSSVSDPAPRTRLAANLASAVSSSAAAGPLARCLSALFDLDSPLRPVPCGDPGTWGGLWLCLLLADSALPLPC
jgi:hypothetical protein